MFSSKSLVAFVLMVLCVFSLLSLLAWNINNSYFYNYDFYYFVLLFLVGTFFSFLVNIKLDGCNVFFSGVLLYFFYSFFLKLIYILIYPEEVKSIRLFDFESIKLAIENNYSYALVFLFSLTITMFIIKSINFKNSFEQGVSKLRWFSYPIIVFFLCMKMLAHYYFGLGIPGVEPLVDIPIFGGVFAFFSRLGLFFIVNTLLFYSFIKSEDGSLKVFSSIMVLWYLFIDLSVGVKFSVIYEMVVLAYIAILLNQRGALNGKHITAILLGFIFVIYSFQYINYYRFALLHGYTGLSAIEFALNNSDANSLSFFHEMINRITGIENFLVTTIFMQSNASIYVTTLLTGEYARDFTENITGISDSINAVGSTQIGAIYVVSGGNYVLFFFLSVVILSSFSLISIFIFKSLKSFFGKKGKVLGELFSVILFVYFLFGSGNYLFFVKEFIVIFMSLTLVLNVFFKREKDA